MRCGLRGRWLGWPLSRPASRGGDPVAGLAITVVICHVGYQVTADVIHRLAGGVDPSVITTAEATAGCPGCRTRRPGHGGHGRTLQVEIDGWADPGHFRRDADAICRQVAAALARVRPQAGIVTSVSRASSS